MAELTSFQPVQPVGLVACRTTTTYVLLKFKLDDFLRNEMATKSHLIIEFSLRLVRKEYYVRSLTHTRADHIPDLFVWAYAQALCTISFHTNVATSTGEMAK